VPIPNPLRLIQRPEYFFHPSQAWRRLRAGRSAQGRLAWGLPIEVDSNSLVGVDILNLGVYDRVVAEALLRLLDAGEDAADIGANIGQNVSIMALAAEARGRIFAFEPGELAWSILQRNLRSWVDWDLAPVIAEQVAISSKCGMGSLRAATDIGGFSLEENKYAIPTGTATDVPLTTLDHYFPDGRIGVMKIDVEGHELAVLEGGLRMLRERRIRDIVFEDFQPQPSSVVRLLESAGYSVRSIHGKWRRPVLLDVQAPREGISAPNFLGTLDAERALARFAPAGWRCLRIRARRRADRV
jgi:FkbM family methyltransferase